MRSGRSARACQRCKQRRVKCDKTLPTCIRCANFGQACTGYPLFKTFIDQGSQARERVTRRQDQTSITPPHTSRNESSPTNITQTPLTTPRTSLRHSSIALTRSDRLSDQQDTLSTIDEILDGNILDAEDRTDQGAEYFDLDIESYYADGNNACGFFANLGDTEAQDVYISTADTAPTVSDARTDQDVQSTPSYFQPEDLEADPMMYGNESALLMRLFVEMLAPWMDLFDLEAYFTRVVPHIAAFDKLLQFALKAVAAKQTARYAIQQGHSKFSKLFDLVLAEHPEDSSDQWFYRAASYYDQGISNLRTRLQLRVDRHGIPEVMTSTDSDQPTTSTLSYTSSPTESVQIKARTHEQNLLLAVSMLSFYETLDECFEKSSQHLSGFLALTRSSDVGTPSLQPEARLLSNYKSAGRAAFWYFVRKDMFESYARCIQPTFDPDHRPPWIAAGLPHEVFSVHLNNNRNFRSENIPCFPVAGNLNVMTYILIWLSVRVVRIIGTSDHNQSTDLGVHSTPSTSISLPQTQAEETNIARTTEWTMIREQLSWWFESRHEIFHSYASDRAKFVPVGEYKIQKTNLFTCSTGAAAMQLYHFIQILLLLNQPALVARESNQASKLRGLKKNSEEIELHSREICAIALEMPNFAVQRQMSYPLQLAGIYLDSPHDQTIIQKTLKTIFMETCSPTRTMMQESAERQRFNATEPP